MNETWKNWEGRTVDGRYLLQAYLGGSDAAVFLTSWPNAGAEGKAAIKLIPVRGGKGEAQIERWKKIGNLNHSNLLSLYESGRCKLDGLKFAYVVMEYAEENLGQIVPERALTPEEARGMLLPVLRALRYVHENGLAHGRIRPSNILAAGDQVKLASDSLAAEGATAGAASTYDPPEGPAATAAGDVWRLGVTLVEVLTQRVPGGNGEVPSTVPEPFRALAAECLRKDVERRPTAEELLQSLESGQRPARKRQGVVAIPSAAAGERRSSERWLVAGGLAAALAVGGFLWTRSKPAAAPMGERSVSSQAKTAAESVQPAALKTAVDSTPAVAMPVDDVVKRVMPEISAGARRTIHGTIPVKVKVRVDADGDVVKAKVESGRASKYFKRLALEAAQDWKFSPLPNGGRTGDREWKLQFAFRRSKVDASAERAR